MKSIKTCALILEQKPTQETQSVAASSQQSESLAASVDESLNIGACEEGSSFT